MSDLTVCVCVHANMHLWFVAEQALVDLHHNALPTQYDWGLQMVSAANISKPLNNIYCCSSITL